MRALAGEPSLLLATAHPPLEDWVRAELADSFEVVAQAATTGELLSLARRHRPKLVVLSRYLPGDPPVADALRSLRADLADTRVILLLGALDPAGQGLANLAISLGVYDVIPGRVEAPALERLLRAPQGYADVAPLHTAQPPPAEASPPLEGTTAIAPRPAEAVKPSGATPPVLLAVWSPKGGCGATSVAVNLATRLASGGAAVGLLDFHFYHPHCHLHLGVEAIASRHGLEGLLTRRPGREPPRPDRYYLRAGRVALLPGVFAEPESLQAVDREAVQRVLHDARRRFSYTVVDVSPEVDDVATLLALRAANLIYLVLEPEPAALEDAYRSLTLLGALGLPKPRFRAALNRCGEGDVPAGDVERLLGVPVAGRIPLDVPRWRNATANGQPLAVTDAEPWDELLAPLLGSAEPPARRDRKGWWRR